MRLITIIERYPKLSIILFTSLIMLPNLSGLWVNIMEARNFISAREMVETNNWLLPTLNGFPRYQKPPLPTIITALSGMHSGFESVFWLRFPTTIMVCTTGIYTFLFSKHFLKPAQAIFSGFIVVSSFYVLMICHEAPWDIYTHAFMLVAIVNLLQLHKTPNYKYLFIAAIFIGLSILSKGPVSLYSLLLPFLFAYGVSFGFSKKYLLKTIATIGIGVIIGGSWFIYVRLADPSTFVKTISSETSNWVNYQIKPLYYYWTFFLQSGMWSIPAFIGLCYPLIKNKVANPKAYKLSFWWTIFALVLLSVIPEKKSRYLMPVLIPLAVNTSFYIEYLIRQFPSKLSKLERFITYFNFGGLGLIGVAAPPLVYFIFREKANLHLPHVIFAALSIILVSLPLLYYTFGKHKLKASFYAQLLFFGICCATTFPLLVKFQNQNEDFASIKHLHKQAKSQNLEVYLFDTISPELLWDYGSTLPLINKHDSTYDLPELERFGLLVNNKQKLLESNIHETHKLNTPRGFNRNTLPKGSHRHKTRNIIYYYIITPKETKD
jgi:4-amino-4-deoxy-L-arabinose transferase-like glycosyltransferase